MVGCTVIKELNIFGKYIDGPWKTDEEIIKASKTPDLWFPGETVLFQFARSGGIRIKVEGAINVWNFLALIVRFKPDRINIFTHGTDNREGYVGFYGKVVEGNVEFIFSTPGQDPSKISQQDTSLDADLMQTAEDNDYEFWDAKSGKLKMADVRKVLKGDCKEIVIYACHIGLAKPYIKSVANFLKVKVSGFTTDIRYFPIPSKDGKKILYWEYSAGDGEKVRDYHKLKPNVTEKP